MDNNFFIPKSIDELYKKMTDEKFVGTIFADDDWLTWKLPNSIIIKVAINNHPGEGYIETYYCNGKKEIYLTHWHPDDDEIYKDLLDINTGQIFWVRRKESILNCSFRPIIIMEKRYWEKLSERKKSKYIIIASPITR